MTRFIRATTGIVAGLLLSACGQHIESSVVERTPISVRDATAERGKEPIQPIPQHVELDAAKVELGEKLFRDERLSRDNSISCASCHDLSRGGTDGRALPVGIGKAVGGFNSPTVFNSSFNFRQFWDGRAVSLEDQIDGPVQAAKEMASTWKDVIDKLNQSSDYVAAFKSVYRSGITAPDIKDAIATFERSLNTPNSAFDRYLRGEREALTAEERQGYTQFKEYGCVACHQGINVGGNMFQRLGVMADESHASDPVLADTQMLKVPSLRNVALTAPYFHDGSATRLQDAVAKMAIYQLGRVLTPEDIDLIVKFLGSLTGEYKGNTL